MVAAKFLVAVAALVLLAACAMDPGVRPYWALHQSEFNRLKPGMTKAEVDALLGKPILVSTFPRMEEEVWDYRYMNTQLRMVASLHFDPQGALKYHTERLDPAYNRGGMSH
jgi:outer membrane protein assembly factor BamE (lipoprotein component of BamABCDE complex)